MIWAQEGPVWEERAGRDVTSVHRCLLSTYSVPWSGNVSEHGPWTALGIPAGARSWPLRPRSCTQLSPAWEHPGPGGGEGQGRSSPHHFLFLSPVHPGRGGGCRGLDPTPAGCFEEGRGPGCATHSEGKGPDSGLLRQPRPMKAIPPASGG